MKCEYCNSNITSNNENCPKCGAPAYAPDGFERCSCGQVLADKPMRFEIPEIICHKCGNIFGGSFYGVYDRDIVYPNGQITHLYRTKGLICPNCLTEFVGHEFYHALMPGTKPEKLKSVAKESKLIESW